MKVLLPEAVLEADITELADDVSAAPFRYQLTDGERDALAWIGNRYTIAQILADGLQESDEGACYLEINPFDVAEALAADDVDRVPCLSDETALQRIVWAIGPAS
tara:strand:- start:457 stop:771 length:315 start_codon:yes stop_codon:yes gene_type:complete